MAPAWTGRARAVAVMLFLAGGFACAVSRPAPSTPATAPAGAAAPACRQQCDDEEAACEPQCAAERQPAGPCLAECRAQRDRCRDACPAAPEPR